MAYTDDLDEEYNRLFDKLDLLRIFRSWVDAGSREEIDAEIPRISAQLATVKDELRRLREGGE